MTRRGLVVVGILLLVILALLSGCFLLNTPPVASFTRSPSFGQSPLSVFFNAETSTDSDGTIASYDWSFGDGASGTGVTTTHTYETPGTYSAELTVTDDRGARDSTIRMVTVEDAEEEAPVGVEIGQIAPEFTLEDFQGEGVSLSDLRGQVVILDFWASWCSPCRYSMPHLDDLGGRYQDQGLVVLGVCLDQDGQDAADFLSENGYSHVLAVWESYEAAQAVKLLYNVDGIPHTFLLDRQGIIRYSDHPIRLRDHHIEPWL